jgi:hypothetical protein
VSRKAIVYQKPLSALELWSTYQLPLPHEDRTAGTGMIDQYLCHVSEVLSAGLISLEFTGDA